MYTYRYVITLIAIGIGTIVGSSAVAQDDKLSAIAEMALLYSLSEREAEARLRQEELANDAYQRILQAKVEGYAGAWFDANKGTIVVALSGGGRDHGRVKALGAEVVPVKYSLQELEAEIQRVRSVSDWALLPGEIRATSVDFKRNRAVVEVVEESIDLRRV